jgi:biotin carboxyl carrier protein
MDLELTGDTKYYDNKYIAIAEDLEGKAYTLSDIGQEVKTGESICTLEAIDAETNVASIVLTDANR